MVNSSKILAPAIYQYDNTFDFSENIISICTLDNDSWIINNQNAVDWEEGDRIVGYDEYPIMFNFGLDKDFIILGKIIFDAVKDYSKKNLTFFESIDYCVIRKYSCLPSFLELESPDIQNPSRKITAISFLNTTKDGSSLSFKNFNISVSPQPGTTVVFPSSFAYSFKISRPKDKESFIVITHFV